MPFSWHNNKEEKYMSADKFDVEFQDELKYLELKEMEQYTP